MMRAPCRLDRRRPGLAIWFLLPGLATFVFDKSTIPKFTRVAYGVARGIPLREPGTQRVHYTVCSGDTRTIIESLCDLPVSLAYPP